MKYILTTLLLVCAVSQVCAKLPFVPGTDPEEERLRRELAQKKTGKLRVDALLDLGYYFIRKTGEKKEDLDQGIRLAEEGRDLSLQLKYIPGYNRAMIVMATGYIERGDSRTAFDIAAKLTDSSRADVLSILSYYYCFGGQITRDFDSSLHCSSEALVIARRLRLYNKQLSSLISRIYVFLFRNDSRASIQAYGELIEVSKKVNVPDLHWYLSQLSAHHINVGNYNLAYQSSVEAIRLMEKSGDFSNAGIVYENMANACRNTGQFLKCVDYLELAFTYRKKSGNIEAIWNNRASAANAWLKMEQPKEAIEIMQKTAAEYPPNSQDLQWQYLRTLANAYRVAKQDEQAEKFYMEMLQRSNAKGKPDFASYKEVGQFYVERERYKEAAPYIKPIESEAQDFGLNVQSHYYYLLYKVDSATGDYLGALNALRKNKMIDDSLYQETKLRHLREMQVQYETEKKDQALRLKEQDILLLSRQAELREKDFERTRLQLQFESMAKEHGLELAQLEAVRKDKDIQLRERNIQLLTKEALLKESSLKNAHQARNVTLAGIGLLLIILGLLYNQYRIKQRNSRELDVKNKSLQGLVSEKELLLREVHHRVKNNLHTIISLLETQSAYLKDDALAAVQNSQHRVYAMSLIHQKLYQVENSTSINMAVYLPELLHYLRDSFDMPSAIRFETNIENIQLDISQAIPAGLIMNEAITNSIKYAFPGKQQGVISIEMVQNGAQKVRFSVADNGIGLPANWSNTQRNSLGLKLMKGLSEDIKASFTIESKGGTRIIVEFEQTVFLQNSKKAIAPEYLNPSYA